MERRRFQNFSEVESCGGLGSLGRLRTVLYDGGSVTFCLCEVLSDVFDSVDDDATAALEARDR
jgi:hypothetical protein